MRNRNGTELTVGQGGNIPGRTPCAVRGPSIGPGQRPESAS